VIKATALSGVVTTPPITRLVLAAEGHFVSFHVWERHKGEMLSGK
jgi:hypothetical protein